MVDNKGKLNKRAFKMFILIHGYEMVMNCKGIYMIAVLKESFRVLV